MHFAWSTKAATTEAATTEAATFSECHFIIHLFLF
jgi:hypothetical protein